MNDLREMGLHPSDDTALYECAIHAVERAYRDARGRDPEDAHDVLYLWMEDDPTEWAVDYLQALLEEKQIPGVLKARAARYLLRLGTEAPYMWPDMVGIVRSLADMGLLNADAVESLLRGVASPCSRRSLGSAQAVRETLGCLLAVPGLTPLARRRVAVAGLCFPAFSDRFGEAAVKAVETSSTLNREEKVDALWRPLRARGRFDDLLDGPPDPSLATMGDAHVPGGVCRHCVPALYRLGEPAATILARAVRRLTRCYVDYAGFLGALDLLALAKDALPRTLVEKYLKLGLKQGTGAVRKRAYEVAAMVWGPAVWQDAAKDSNASIRKAAEAAMRGR